MEVSRNEDLLEDATGSFLGNSHMNACQETRAVSLAPILKITLYTSGIQQWLEVFKR